MLELPTEPVRLLLVVSILAVNSYTDVARRTVWGGDRRYAALGAAGLALWLLSSPPPLEYLSAVAGVTASLFLWRIKCFGSGDAVLGIVISVTLPSLGGIGFIPVIAVLGSCVMAPLAVVAFNVTLNSAALLWGRRPFAGRGLPVRLAAFCLLHERRDWEKHAIPAEKDGTYTLRPNPIDSEFSTIPGGIVAPAMPMIPFFLGIILAVFAAGFLV